MSETQECNNYNNVDNDEAEAEAELHKSQAMVYNHLFGYADTLTLRAAIQLRLADIIHSHGQPMSLSEIASKIESPSPHIGWLERVMRMLVRKHIFTINYDHPPSGEVLYGLTATSKWLLRDQEQSLAPVFLTLSDPTLVKPWFEISQSIKDGENAFVKAHGESMFEMFSSNPEFKSMFNSGLGTLNKPILDSIIKRYKEGFSELLDGTVIDVGGGGGKLVAEIVAAYPHIKGINFDLPHVVANAPQHPGVDHVGGDMFQEIPTADCIILKSVLHNWTHEKCLNALGNCQKAISGKEKGRVLVVDIVLNPFGNAVFDDATVALDLMMMINSPVGGKDRTEDDWRKLLNEAGFTRVNFIPLQTIMSFSIIEAFV